MDGTNIALKDYDKNIILFSEKSTAGTDYRMNGIQWMDL
jgi:hypothetical protein